jgi:hypothetical protein
MKSHLDVSHRFANYTNSSFPVSPSSDGFRPRFEGIGHWLNQTVRAIAIVSTLVIAQGCTQLAQAPKDLTATTTSHPTIEEEEPAMTATSHSQIAHEATNHSHTEPIEHDNDQANAEVSTQAKLTTAGAILPNTLTVLQIDVQDGEGKAIAQFDRFQEQTMHLIAVSDDLQVFQHLHPTYKGNGRFEVAAQFPKSGSYTLFSDYQPTGLPEQVSVLKTQVGITNTSTPEINWSRTKTFGTTTVGFTPNRKTVRVGEDVVMQFDLQDATSGKPATDLQTYLGEKGHLVILRQSDVLGRENYIHAHAVHNTPAHQVHFATHFSQPGLYKLWGQFNRNGEIITADFWVEVVQ